MGYELIALQIGLLILLAYYIVVWLKVGKDPPKGSITPLYDVPEGLSPAAMRYIRRMDFDLKCFTASLINMAVKGLIRIEETHGKYTIIREMNSTTALTKEEKEILGNHEEGIDGLFDNRSSIELVNSNYFLIGSAYTEVELLLMRRYQKQDFNTNRLRMIPGMIITILTLAASLVMNASDEQFGGFAGIIPSIFISLWISVWSFGAYAVVSKVMKSWNDVKYGIGMKGKAGNTTNAGLYTFVAILFIGVYIAVLRFLLGIAGPVFILMLLIVMVTNFIFYKLLPALTKEGRALLDKIDGFREYLSMAESDNPEMCKGPEITPALFEKFLPYALALDVEQAWSKKFTDALERASQSLDRGGYTPMWYSGSMTGLSTEMFASSLERSISGAISSSATAPGSSSGSGGGGPSGGGGGEGEGGGF